MTIIGDTLYHHIEMVAIGQSIAIGLVHTLMKIMSLLTYRFYRLRMLLETCFIILSCHKSEIFAAKIRKSLEFSV